MCGYGFWQQCKEHFNMTTTTKDNHISFVAFFFEMALVLDKYSTYDDMYKKKGQTFRYFKTTSRSSSTKIVATLVRL